ncbi:MAG TPA: DUF4157 domain-containing protein [Nostocaceae cyanobacterium]|nr:DUF4157 domain-containing protein [Nostocaceae cyanobacterium]
MSRYRIQKPSFSNYTVAKKSSPLTQVPPWTNAYQQKNAENAQKPANTVKIQTTEEWKKDNVFLKVIETLEAQQQAIQTKLIVGEAGDKYEQEADAMASKVMSMPDNAVQKQSEENFLDRPLPPSMAPLAQMSVTPDGGRRAAGNNLESRLNSSKGGGSQLPHQVRRFMEPRFGANFSQVRVHTDTTAVQMNRELGAQAFTHGSDIYYGEGKAPGNNELTAHELTHVVQQTGAVQCQSTSSPQTTPLTITSKTVNAAPDGSPNTRTNIGVGEQVQFTGSSSGTWSFTGGTSVGSSNGATFLWQAPATGGNVTITLTKPTTTPNPSTTPTTTSGNITMNVIAPTGLSMTKVSEDSIPSGTAGAGMRLNITINPLNVCLGATELREIPGPATNITGYFTQIPAANLFHHPNPNYTPFNNNNTLCCDHAAGSGFPSPYSDGTFQWDIPNWYRLNNESSGRYFTTTTQLYTIDSAGTVTISKAGASVSRTP